MNQMSQKELNLRVKYEEASQQCKTIKYKGNDPLEIAIAEEYAGKQHILCSLKASERQSHGLERNQMKMPKGLQQVPKMPLEKAFPKHKDHRAFQRKNRC